MGLFSRLKRTFGLGRNEAEIREELQFHLDMDMAGGQTPREARIRLGNPQRVEEETRAMGIIDWLDSAINDARYGLRQLRKTPALVAAIVLSLAIGVGANTAIFSLVDAAILKPLPVRDPDALRIIEWTNEGFPKAATNINGDVSPLAGGRVLIGSSIGANLYRSLAHEQTGFQNLVGIADANAAAVAVDSSPAEQISLQHVSANFFQGIGVVPILGRPFREEEDRVGQEPVVIVSHRFWQQRLGGGDAALQKTIRINNVPARIAGVAPRDFFGLRAGQWTDVYAPLAARVAFQAAPGADSPRGENDRDWWVRPVARLNPSVPERAALAQAAALFRSLVVKQGGGVQPGQVPELISLPGRRGFDALNTKDAGALWMLMLLVGVLLLIVCVNVANLLLSRSVARQRESAVRLALGAPRTRLFRQHLIESAVLAILGGAAGLVLGYALAQAVHLLFQSGRAASSAFDLHLDLRVLGFTAAIAIVTAILFGIAPAFRASSADLNDALKAQTRSVMGGGLRLPRVLVSLQIALCLASLLAAGLLGRSLRNLKWVDVGFDRTNLAYASVNPGQASYSPERAALYVNRVREAIERIPGVLRVSPVRVRLMQGGGQTSWARFPGRELADGDLRNQNDLTDVNNAGEGLLETIGIPVVAGRTFSAGDMRPNSDAAIVDELFVKRFLPNQNPLGQRFGLARNEHSRYEIVGVVRSTRYRSLRDQPLPGVYLPFSMGNMNFRGELHFAIRASIDSGRLAESVRKAIASIDPAVPMTQFHTQNALIDRHLRTERLLGILSSAFGLIALVLSAIGLGGLLAYSVARRSPEIGVRMALGANAGNIVWMVLRDSFWTVGAGVLAGLPGAYFVATYLRSALYRLEPLDPWTATLSLLALILAALLAAWIPAYRAGRIDPMSALREE